ncbi:MAG: hypothetical protein M1831_000463 [Alyxoria varia]|nr:MAG: hypothetical protein M1831_000463 [Alyxoria varia]
MPELQRKRELDALVGSYVHLDKLPRAKDALRSLQQVVSLVKPIMRKRGWRVGTLTEFFPDAPNLLGLNINRGQKICVRLRYAGDKTQFLPLESVVDTMLHELSHNVVGPHNAEFDKLWNELRDEYDDLKIKGYTGEGFLSQGYRLGGKRVPLQEVQRQHRAAAEKRRELQKLQKGSGQKLGGKAVPRSWDIRQVIADAATRRTKITQGCGSGTQEGQNAADEATRNGFRTKAEEDQANDRAIAEALWELAQQDEDIQGDAARNGGNNPSWQTEGLSWSRENGLDEAQQSNGSSPKGEAATWLADADADIRLPSPTSRNGKKPKTEKTFMPDKPGGTPPPPSLTEHPAFRQRPPVDPATRRLKEAARRSSAALPEDMLPPVSSPLAPPERNTRRNVMSMPPPRISSNWTCPICTLSNPADYLCCDACTTERPCHDNITDFSTLSDIGISSPPTGLTNSPVTPSVASTGSFSTHGDFRRSSSAGAARTAKSLSAAGASSQALNAKRQSQKLGWSCSQCGTFMESKWWTCSSCGKMKDAS